MKHPQIAVVGAGVVGLSTAINIQREIPEAHVTIIADKFGSATTSDGAAGIFRPTKEMTPGVPDLLRSKWMKDTWAHLDHLAHSAEAPEAGVSFVSGYYLYDQPFETLLFQDLVYHFRECTRDELKMFPGRRFRNGWFFTTLLCECRRYLPYLMKKFQLSGGRVLVKKLSSLTELAGQYDVVVNCSGFGSRQLLSDEKVVPIRGQLYRVQAPWIKHFVFSAPGNYIIPGQDNVIIGGTKQMGNFQTEVNPADSRAIWDDACTIMPSLKKAKILWEWVGLRPHREPLRLEKETLTLSNGQKIKVVHNYGHGATGVSLSWGTAVHATKCVQEFLKSFQPSKL